MAYGDIQRLRQQYIFQPTEDISGGGMDYGPPPVDYGDGYDYGGGGGDMGPQPQQATPTPQQMQGPPPPITPPRAPSYDPNASIQATIDAINRVYTPENVDRDRLRNLMDNVPKRQAPSLARAIVAGGLSIKAQDPVAAAEKVMYAPYNRDIEDWKTKADPFYKTAELENRANINERTLAGNVVTSVTAAERLAEQARVADQKNEVAMERNRINNIKARMGKGYTMNARGPTVIVQDTATGKVTDTGISTGWMSEADKIDAEGQWDVDAAAARGEAGVKVAQAAATANNRDILSQDEVLYKRNPDGSMSPVSGIPTGTPTRVGTPRTGGTTGNTLEKRRQLSDTLKNHYQYDNDNKEFIKRNNNDTYDFANRPKVTPKGFFGGGEVTADKVKAYDEFRASIDPSYVPPSDSKPGGVGGSMGSGKEEPPKSKGLAPDIAPGAISGAGPGGYTSSIDVKPGMSDIDLPAEQYRTFTDKTNPRNKRRTKDGGKTFEYSHDGGQTWGKR